jgi:hypothetical protein
VGQIPLGSLTPPTYGKRLYSFGALSDIHLQQSTGSGDFQRALTYLTNTEKVAFTCVCGDLVGYYASEANLSAFKTYVDTYSADTPVYAITGNHDVRSGLKDSISEYTGNPLYYSFEYGNDVFIMVGINVEAEGSLFTTEELQWLYEMLEANRNKRCFVFHHVRPQDGCGNAMGIYTYDIWGGTEATVFESLMHHYKNAHQFHGHSHLKFYLQKYADNANVAKDFGGWSIHIPSLAVPRDTNGAVNPSAVDVYAASEGYVVDVYENGIHLRGRDFIKGVFLPVASYWLDTALKEVEEYSYEDPTGTIVVGCLVILDDGAGNVPITSRGTASITDDGAGNVDIDNSGATAITDDGAGNVTIS